MRALLWVLLLGSLAGGVLLWLDDAPPQEQSGLPGLDEGAGGDVRRRLEEDGPVALTVERPELLVVTPAAEWPQGLVREGHPFADPRIVDSVVKSPDGEEYMITGADMLEILRSQFPNSKMQFHVKDDAALEAFKRCKVRDRVPGEAAMRMLFDMFQLEGFAFMSYGDRHYVLHLEEGEIPGVGRPEDLPEPVRPPLEVAPPR